MPAKKRVAAKLKSGWVRSSIGQALAWDVRRQNFGAQVIDAQRLAVVVTEIIFRKVASRNAHATSITS